MLSHPAEKFRNLVTYVGMLLLACVIWTAEAAADTRIASWNMKRLDSSDADLKFETAARVMAHFDFISVQEVMDEPSLLRLVNELQEVTGSEWGMMPSHAIGRGSYKEHYAFFWRKSEVQYVDGAVVYLDSRDVFAREPLSARFRTNEGETFVAANIHVLYGDGKEDRVPEIKALASYWAWLGESFPNEQFFLMGDFNMEPKEYSWDALKQVATPLITVGGTTLAYKDGEYANLYDNIWVPNNLRAHVQAGIFDLPSYTGMSNKQTRDQISDHAPVYMILSDMDEESGHFDPRMLKLEEQTSLIRGNKNSEIYHLPGCGSYNDMARSPNLQEFATEQMAIQAGYRRARNCS